MSIHHRLDHPAAASGVMTRLRLWAHLWHRYASGEHLEVSGADALRARAAGQRATCHGRVEHASPLEG